MCVADNGVHRCPDIVGHIEQELALRETAFHRADLFPLRRLMLFPHQVLYIQHDDHSREYDQQKYRASPPDRSFHAVRAVHRQQHFDEPHQGGIDQQSKEDDARGRDPAVLRQRAVVDSAPVKKESQQAPQGKKEKCFAAHRLHGRQPRDQLDQAKDDGNDCSQHSRYNDTPVPFRPGGLPRRGGGVSVPHDGAEGSQVHEPAKGVPPRKREQDRDDHDEQDAVRRIGKAIRKDLVLRHRCQHPGGGTIPPDDPGQDGSHCGDRHDSEAEGTHDRFRRVESRNGIDAPQAAQSGDVFLPGGEAVRYGSDADQRH